MRPRPALTGKIPTKRIEIDLGNEKKESGKMSKTEQYVEMRRTIKKILENGSLGFYL